ncbi:MAG: YtxH domain-containing protein [Anaerolineae bacterium]|nr:YtxH domain-containing protein [Anaerolineae bacterium]
MARDGGGEFLTGFLIGGLIGAGLALLFAPQPGKETISQLRQKGEELKQRFSDLSLDEAKEFITRTVQEAIKEGKIAAIRTKEEMLGRLEQAGGEEAEAGSTGEIQIG